MAKAAAKPVRKFKKRKVSTVTEKILPIDAHTKPHRIVPINDPEYPATKIEISEKFFRVEEQEPEHHQYLIKRGDYCISVIVYKDGTISLGTPLMQNMKFIKSKKETVRAIGELLVMAAMIKND